MKTLCDLFQHHCFDYELYEDESGEFGTIGILYYARHTVYVQPFGLAAQDILDKAGAHIFHHVLYVPNLSDEEILTLAGANMLVQHIGLQSSPDVPTEVLVQLRRNRRSWLVNYLSDFANPAIRAYRLELLAYSVGPLATYIGLKALF
ncbi:hypothetical protein G6L37_11770 [Agrobacterium rubi]|uniref:hypothetical protein n=1 Tax=Agrobacterium rubi TaxID=28099 RepID=UPI001573A723|nr:hypothetical protein [Agrobacterium rubi]NTF06839.1 hypothetical protein [Agrobacterium rubi]NTF19081.1 hypothetical protein [Agrobacterium rubi]NTF26044.1 hypothetical protein [Agrobacterium rubi]